MLHVLNNDVLLCVVDHLEATSHSLIPLSSTCRLLRDVCRPLIFRHLTRRLANEVSDSESFCPSTVSCLIQSLIIVDCCVQQEEGLKALFSQQGELLEDGSVRVSEVPFLCDHLDGPELMHALRRMPALRHLTLASSKGGILHGVRWRALKAVLSLPQLTEISLSGLLFSPLLPDDLRADDLVCPHLQHIKTFRYEVPSFRVSSWGTRERYPFHSEEEMLCRVLERLRHSVEMLALSSEPAPIQTMAQWRWPKLRELKLTGERWAEPLTPVVSLFAKMPHLRKLALELTLVRGQLSQVPPLWPRGYIGAFPWPNLTHLSLSHPHPEDELFTNLPSALRSLSLCCHPHKWQKLLLGGSGTVHHRYKYVVLDSSKMLIILSRCRTPQLTHLELEYNADEGENDLLRYLAASFPLLTSLQVHRYRAINNSQAQAMITGARTIDDVNFQAVDDFGRSLSELTHLRTLKAFLDYEDTPRPRFTQPRMSGFGYSREDANTFTATLHRAASVLSRAMSDAVRHICLWRPRGIDGYEWLVFRIVRGGLVTGLEVRCEEDLEHTQR